MRRSLWYTLGTTLASFLAAELANTAWKAYWDEAPRFVAHADVDAQCDLRSRTLGPYCDMARESLRHGFAHAVLSRTFVEGRWCLGHRCADLYRDVVSNVMTTAKWLTVFGSTGLIFSGPVAQLCVEHSLRWWRSRPRPRKLMPSTPSTSGDK